MKPGAQRAELDATLRAAYAQGLLSTDTFTGRMGELLSSGSVAPERIVGDVTVRRDATRPGRLIDALVAFLRRPATARARRGLPLLGLDWSGVREELLVGRGDGCDVRLDAPTVSRRHALLSYREGTWIVRDLGSRNGISLNGRGVGRARLAPGDLIAFADHRFRVD